MNTPEIEDKPQPKIARALTLAMGMAAALLLMGGQFIYWFVGPDTTLIDYATWPTWLGSGVVFAALGAAGFAGAAASRKDK